MAARRGSDSGNEATWLLPELNNRKVIAPQRVRCKTLGDHPPGPGGAQAERIKRRKNAVGGERRPRNRAARDCDFLQWS